MVIQFGCKGTIVEYKSLSFYPYARSTSREKGERVGIIGSCLYTGKLQVNVLLCALNLILWSWRK